MKSYHSTRNKKLTASFHEAVLNGIAPDGGLYVKDNLQDAKINLDEMIHYTYQQTAEKVLSFMMDDFTPEQIKECITNAYGSQWSHKQIAPVIKAGDVNILELFHGPTSAFKDIALQMLPQMISQSLKMEPDHKNILILTATSGDTGKAALEGFKDVDGLSICVFYPDGLVSQVQKQQMVTTTGNNTKVVALKGNFDDAQRTVKVSFADKELNETAFNHNIQFSSANSINIGRLCPQIVYYFDSYLQMVRNNEITLGDEVNFVVPTGNFGNILAGYYAKKMGLPVHKLICASNHNNVLNDFFTTGTYDRNRALKKTISPSMDILVSSNLERLLYEFSESDETTASWMKELNENGLYQIDQDTLLKMQDIFYSGYCKDEDCAAWIKEVYEKDNYVMDPHTACGYKVLKDYIDKTNDKHKCILLSTASPFKFCKDVLSSITNKVPEDEWQCMNELEKISAHSAPVQLQLKDAPVLHDTLLALDEVKDMLTVMISEGTL